MIGLIQRVTKAKVSIDNKIYSQIEKGYVILLGIFDFDSQKDIDTLIKRIVNIRIMADENNKMNLSIKETNNEILVVSQFTLCADTSKGRRPSFIHAKNPKSAELLYIQFVEKIKEKGIKIKTGEFGTYMNVEIHNDGPVTITLDSKK